MHALRVLTFLCPILVGWGRHWIPGSGKSTHERKGPWPVIPGPGRRREVIWSQWSKRMSTCSIVAVSCSWQMGVNPVYPKLHARLVQL